MKTVKYIKELQENLALARKTGKNIGLIPTMGALHEGHLSLIKAAARDNDFLLVTIFVNPKQFNNKADLERYPRTLESDLALLKDYSVDIVFTPSEVEMYPSKERRQFDLSPLDTVMEEKFRPGHFSGVAEIVSRLFEISSPDNAYFGLKDFQQLAIIRKMAKSLNMNFNIIACPTIREKGGLAMSSRNQLLTTEQHFAAQLIYKTLLKSKELKNSHSTSEIVSYVTEEINGHPLMHLEYFEIVDDESLMPVVSWESPVNKIGCIAVQLEEIRLIDNIYFD